MPTSLLGKGDSKRLFQSLLKRLKRREIGLLDTRQRIAGIRRQKARDISRRGNRGRYRASPA